MVAPSLWQGPRSPGWDGIGGRKEGGGHPALRPKSFQLGACGENGGQTVETGSADRPQAARAVPGWPAPPPTQTLRPLALREGGAFFRDDIRS